MDLLVDPCALPCDHIFCRKCIKLVVKRKMLCPMCRVAVDAKFTPKLAKEFQDRLKEKFPEEFQQEIAKLEDENTLRLEFVYGYTIKKKANPAGSFGAETKYEYTLYLKCKNPEEKVSKFVSKARFSVPIEKRTIVAREAKGKFEVKGGETTKDVNVVLKIWWERSLRKWERTLVF